MSGDKTGRAYVEQAREELHQYAQALLRENEKLRAAVATLESDNRRLEQGHDHAIGELMRLRGRFEEIEKDNHSFAARYQQIEEQTGNLSNLYVASYQLHSSVDRQDVLRTIQEIVVNLIGSEEIAIFERDGSGRFRLASSIGVDTARLRQFEAGDGPMGQHLAGGEIYINEGVERDDHLTACVPLRVDGRTIGALVVFRLLAHKTSLERVDRELFELLAVHAATALYCATLHAKSLQAVAV